MSRNQDRPTGAGSAATEPLEVTLRAPAQTMFGAPQWSPDERYDVVVLGVPSDSGGLGHRTPATAPSFLRSISGLFPPYQAGEAIGWFDYEAGRGLLEGLRLADAGDYPWLRWRGPEQFDALPAVYATLRASTRLLLILGGDHSISYGLGRAMSPREGLVWIDAHEDATDRRGPWPHCGNVVSYLDELDQVRLITQLGLRGMGSNRRSAMPAKRHHCQSVEAVLEHFRGQGLTRAVTSIDVDVLDPRVMPAVGSAMPDGRSYQELLGWLRLLRQGGLEIPVLELAEFAPTSDADTTYGVGLLNFILRACAVCLAPPETGG